MLTNSATLYLVDICDKYPDNKYLVVEWEDLKAISTQEDPNFDLQALWKELKMNGCLVNKYADEQEVCFTLTDKARVLVQEYKAYLEQMKAQAEADDKEPSGLDNAFIKTDENGSLVVMPSSNDAVKKRKFEVKKLKKSAMGRGFLGGLLSGGIMGLIFGVLGAVIISLLM
ncbi:MAG: hypothetical protein K2K85_01355 [Clostridia bacterium]|nr:hypothetical protein [Clostridia bacterium]MDE6604654.1 hypothetical protein [Clostridia bacterium]